MSSLCCNSCKSFLKIAHSFVKAGQSRHAGLTHPSNFTLEEPEKAVLSGQSKDSHTRCLALYLLNAC